MPKKTTKARQDTSGVRGDSWLDGAGDGPRLGLPMGWWRGEAQIQDGVIKIIPTHDYLPHEHGKKLLLAMASLGHALHLRNIAPERLIPAFIKRYGLLKHGKYEQVKRSKEWTESVDEWSTDLINFYEAVNWYCWLRMAAWGDESAINLLKVEVNRWLATKGNSKITFNEERVQVWASVFLAELLNKHLSGATVHIISGSLLQKLKMKKTADPAEFYLTSRVDNLLQFGYRELALSAVDRSHLLSCVICLKIYEGRRNSKTCSAACRKALFDLKSQSCE